MTGFCGIFSNDKNLDFLNNETTICKTDPFKKQIFGKWSSNKIFIWRQINNKFLNDKLFKHANSRFVCTDGVFLNSKKMINEAEVPDLFDLIKGVEDDPMLLKGFRGNFAGVIINENKNRIIIFTDHFGSKPVYYYKDKEFFIFGSDMKMISEAMKMINISPIMDEESVNNFLSFGCYPLYKTIIKDVYKLPAGSLVEFEDNNLNITNYYTIDNTPFLIDDEELIIEELDRRFSIAIRDEYEKDIEYGYKHIANLSAGLDSRMNVCYAKKLGYGDLVTICFSENDYYDEKISKRISSDWKFEHLFYSLNNGIFLKNIDEHIWLNSGQSPFANSAHHYSMLRLINFDNFGLSHTGMVGDAVIGGSFLNSLEHESVQDSDIKFIGDGYFEQNNNTKKIVDYVKSFDNLELMRYYLRVELFTFTGYRVTEAFTEYSSPFLHVDFFSFAVKIPPKYRYRSQIYLKWINKKAPEAANYVWERTKLKPNGPNFLSRPVRLFYAFQNQIRKKFGMKTYSMNPYQYWYDNNEELKDLMFRYHKENQLSNLNPKVLKSIEDMINSDIFSLKVRAITLEGTIKLLFKKYSADGEN